MVPSMRRGLVRTGLGLPLTGDAVIDDDAGTFSMVAASPGGTRLRYQRDCDGEISVSGRWQGDRVEESG